MRLSGQSYLVCSLLAVAENCHGEPPLAEIIQTALLVVAQSWCSGWEEPPDTVCGFGANFAAQCTTRSQTAKPESFILSRKSPFWQVGNVTHCRLKAELCSRMHVKVNTKQEHYNLEKSVLHPAPIHSPELLCFQGEKGSPGLKGENGTDGAPGPKVNKYQPTIYQSTAAVGAALLRQHISAE